MEISSIEFNLIVNQLTEDLKDYYINNIYLIDENVFVIKLHHSTKIEKRLAISPGKGLWITKYLFEYKKPSGFLSVLRKKIGRSKIESINQPDGERIVILNLYSSRENKKLICEFFGEGNLILTDKDDNIILTLKKLKVKHREISYGRKYLLPPSKAIDFYSLTTDSLIPSLQSELEISRWLGRNFFLSKKYVEEILKRAEIEPSTKGIDLSYQNIQQIYSKIKEIIKLLEGNESQSLIVLDNGEPVDATPFHFISYQDKQTRICHSFIEAIDEVFTHGITSKKREDGLRPLSQKIKEIEHSLEKLARQRQDISLKAEAFRTISEKINNEVVEKGIQDVKGIRDKIVLFGADNVNSRNNTISISIMGSIIEIDENNSVMKFISKLYDHAKNLEIKLQSIESAEKSLIEKRDSFRDKFETKEIDVKSEEKKIKRERKWFERYRWLLTSEGLLAIGGRDATSNTIIIRRHLDNSDLVFHADVPGSPFFILKNGEPEMKDSIDEVAQTVACYSKAWKENFASVDAYYIKPKQVKIQAPSGMYLPKGSFLIEGKKNYVKDLEMKMAIGLHKMEQGMAIMGGAINSIKKNCFAYLVIAPYKELVSDVSKKIKMAFFKNIEDKQLLKTISLDDIVRALPGGAMIISFEKGEQSINV